MGAPYTACNCDTSPADLSKPGSGLLEEFAAGFCVCVDNIVYKFELSNTTRPGTGRLSARSGSTRRPGA